MDQNGCKCSQKRAGAMLLGFAGNFYCFPSRFGPFFGFQTKTWGGPMFLFETFVCFGSLTKPNWWFANSDAKHFVCFASLTKPNWWFANSDAYRAIGGRSRCALAPPKALLPGDKGFRHETSGIWLSARKPASPGSRDLPTPGDLPCSRRPTRPFNVWLGELALRASSPSQTLGPRRVT